MSLRRRDALRLLGGAGVLLPFGLAGCGAGNRLPRVLASAAPLPAPFQVPLPVPPVLKPTDTTGPADRYELTLREGSVEILPGLRTTVWGFDGRFPGPTVEGRSGRAISVQHTNTLPVPVVTHLHGGRTPPDSDGYPTDLILPANGSWSGGHGRHDPRASVTTGIREYRYPHQQRAATLWYHDHRMDFTGPQIWRGLAGFHIIRDDAEEALALPRGDREIPLMICDRSFEADGAWRYPALDPRLRDRHGVLDDYSGGVLGDVMLVNGAPWPQLEVAAVRYRFRLLNASNARRLELTLDPPPPGGAGIVQVGGDGGLLAAPVALDKLPIAPAERYDVVVDFSRYPVGTAVTLRNSADRGRMGQVMRFRVARTAADDSQVPGKLSDIEQLDPARASRTRTFTLRKTGGEYGWTINGKAFDPARMDARPAFGTTEIWQLTSDVTHPVHLHLVHFQILSRTLRRPANHEAGWKDTIDLRASQTARIIARFDGYRGRYPFHCHNLEHEDMAMMANFEVV